MHKILITTTTGDIQIEAEITDEQFTSTAFTIENSDYMVEVMQNDDNMWVSNAMDGYGYNCREIFKDALIECFPI